MQDFRCTSIDMLTSAVPVCSQIALGIISFSNEGKNLWKTQSFPQSLTLSFHKTSGDFLYNAGRSIYLFPIFIPADISQDTSVGNSCTEQFTHPKAGGSQAAAVVVSWGCIIFLEIPSRTLDSPLEQSLRASHSQPKRPQSDACDHLVSLPRKPSPEKLLISLWEEILIMHRRKSGLGWVYL